MSKEEQIALELTRLANPKDDDSVWADYKWFLEKLSELKSEERNVSILQDEIGTYRFILERIKSLVEQDESNFVLKKQLEPLLGGINDND